MVGGMRQVSESPAGLEFNASVTLIRSKGKAILFDTGTIG